MTQCKLCTRAAAAVNKESSPMGPMKYLETPSILGHDSDRQSEPTAIWT